MAIFQTALGSGVFSDPGADVTKPLLIPSATTPTGSGVPVTPGKLGTVMSGDLGTEFVLGKLVLAANTDLLYGQAYQLDKDYNLTALTTANWVTQSEVVFSQCFAPATLAGTYYLWCARAGHVGVQVATGSAAQGKLETTASAGICKAPGAATSGSRAISPAYLMA